MRTPEQIREYARKNWRKYRDSKMRNHNAKWKPVGEHDGMLVASAALRTYKEVGEIMGLSAERVRQIERTAFWKIRNNKILQEHWNEFKAA